MIKITSTNTLGFLIRDVRKGQKLTQEQLSAIAGVGVRFIREVEQGKETSQIAKVLYIMKMLGIHIFADVPKVDEVSR